MHPVLRQWGFIFAFWAMALTAIIPAGYMPQFSKSGGFITICTMTGAQDIAADQNAMPDGQHQTKVPCAFAVLGSALKNDVAPVVVSHSVLTTPIIYILQTAQFSPRTILQGALSLRGPPIFLV
jgi:hypothetical protein